MVKSPLNGHAELTLRAAGLLNRFKDCVGQVDEHGGRKVFRTRPLAELLRLQEGVDLWSVEIVAVEADEHVAQHFASLLEDAAEKFVQEGPIADRRAALGVRMDTNHGRLDFGSGPKNVSRESLEKFNAALRRQPNGQGPI